MLQEDVYKIVLTKNLPFCKIKAIFKSTTHLCKSFRFQDKGTFNLRSVVNKFSRGICSATCYGVTCRHLSITVDEHSDVSPLTGKKSKVKTTTAIKDYMLLCDHVVSLEDFQILASSNSEFHLKIKESLLILHDKLELNRNEKPLPLYLFD